MKRIKEDVCACIYMPREESWSFEDRNGVSLWVRLGGALVCFGLVWCIARLLNGNRIHSGTAAAAAAAQQQLNKILKARAIQNVASCQK